MILNLNEVNFIEKMNPIYEAIKRVSTNDLTKNKSTIGFVGAPWTLLVYMMNKKSPKLKLIDSFYNDRNLLDKILIVLEKFLKIHIKNQIKNGQK